jgi:hypothetical protein
MFLQVPDSSSFSGLDFRRNGRKSKNSLLISLLAGNLTRADRFGGTASATNHSPEIGISARHQGTHVISVA